MELRQYIYNALVGVSYGVSGAGSRVTEFGAAVSFEENDKIHFDLPVNSQQDGDGHVRLYVCNGATGNSSKQKGAPTAETPQLGRIKFSTTVSFKPAAGEK